MKTLLTITLMSRLLYGCATAPSLPANTTSITLKDALTVCAGGRTISKSMEATLVAKLSKISKGEGAAGVRTQVEDVLEGTIFQGDKISSEQQKIYTECIATVLEKDLKTSLNPAS